MYVIWKPVMLIENRPGLALKPGVGACWKLRAPESDILYVWPLTRTEKLGFLLFIFLQWEIQPGTLYPEYIDLINE